MSKISYTKPPLSYQDQLETLKQRGLHIDSDSKASHLLENVSYYRLSGYWFPLLADKKKHIFKKETEFQTAFNLYCFDRDLRQLVLAETEKIEVAIRAKMSYNLSHSFGAFWFQDPTNFSNAHKHANSLSKLGEEFTRSDEEFIKAFKLKYNNSFPPSWMTLEISSFGTLSLLYKNLKPSKEKREIANYFGLADSVFETWIHSIVYIRNVCAHHTRLWNRAMSIQPQVPRNPRKKWLADTSVANNRIYFILSMVAYLLQIIHPNKNFGAKFRELLKYYSNVDVKAMGFPTNWETEDI